MPNFRRGPASLLVVIAALAPFAAAAVDLPSLMRRADTASQATVFLVPPMALFRDALDEGRMQAASCRYVTADPAAVRALADLLRSADLVDAPVYQRPDIREGVYLTLDDGTQLKLLLQDNLGGRSPVTGVAEVTVGGEIRSTAVVARPTLAANVRGWADRQGGAGSGSACDRLKPMTVAP